MPIPYFIIVIIFAIISILSSNIILADDSVIQPPPLSIQPPPLSYKLRWQHICINKETNQLLFIHGSPICPECWSSFKREDWVILHNQDKLGKTLSLSQEGDDIVTERKPYDKNEASDNIKFSSAINSEPSNNSYSASDTLGNRQNRSPEDYAKTQHVSSYTRKDGTVVRAYDRRPAKR